MLKLIDGLLNKITMYRLVLYELIFLLVAGFGLSFFGMLSFQPVYLLYSIGVIFFACWLVNDLFAWLFDAPSNPESTWITALILALIITPPAALFDTQYLPLALWASGWAAASKYILAIRKKHVFNPAALGAAMTGVFLGLSASWWVGTLAMAPFVLVGGLLIVRKIHRFDLWWSFVGTFFVGIVMTALVNGGNLWQTLSQSFLYAPAFFFGTVMLTEPMTTPPTRIGRVLYGALVGFLFLPDINILGYFLTPELALLLGNVFSYLVSPKHKLLLTLKEKIRLSHDVYEFVFIPERRFKFVAGQYMEWTLAHGDSDSRGIRRYFTIASSPTEREVRLGVKFYSPSSTYKKRLLSMQPGEQIVASQLGGDFTMPSMPWNKKRPLVFIAGGIGITPFRSQLQYLLDTKERRPITVLYANKTPADAVYYQLLERARRELGAKIVYAFSDQSVPLPPGTAHGIDGATITGEVSDYRNATYYISGPQGMVAAFKDTLRDLGIARIRIRTDYFPGFA